MENLKNSLYHTLRNINTNGSIARIYDTLPGTNLNTKPSGSETTKFKRQRTRDSTLSRIITTYAVDETEASDTDSEACYQYSRTYNGELKCDAINSNINKRQKQELERVFEGSSHYYLIYVQDPENDNHRSINLCVMGLIILFIQMLLNYIIIDEGYEELTRNQTPVLINWYQCGLDDDKILDPKLFRCIIRVNEEFYIALAMILVSVFLQYDYFATVKVILTEPNWWSKFAALLIFCEAMATTFACSLWSYQGWYNAEGYDIIMNTVGILFIHDLDEKLYEALSVLKPNEMRLHQTPTEVGCFKRIYKYWICRRIGWFMKWNTKFLITGVFIGFMVIIGRGILFYYFRQIETDKGIVMDPFLTSTLYPS